MSGDYGGNTILQGVSESTGMPLDHINFVASQIVALALAPLMQTSLHPTVTKPATRQAFVLVIGLFLGYFAFGKQAIHLAGLPTLCYMIIRTVDPKIVQRWVMVVALGYLSLIHLHRTIYDTGVYALDITGPLMVMTQKITSLAFSLHDGTKSEKELKPNQKYYAIEKIPSALEFYSYMFHFSTLMAGPMVFYNDYMDFITGQNFLKRSPVINGHAPNEKRVVIEPRRFYPVMKKLAISLVCAIMFSVVVYPIERAKDEDFLNSGIIYQTFYLYISTGIVRLKYYHAWVLSDAINNISGFGFNGFTPDGKQKWDLLTGVDIMGFEFGQSLRECIQSWNTSTNAWLRMVVYERVPKNRGVPLTFALSAVWHGFFPGYYLTFASAALFTEGLRVVRKYIRPHFLDTPGKKQAYDVMSMLFTRVLMTYITFPFVLLSLKASVWLYWNMYCWLHVLGFATIFILPKLKLGQSEAQLRNRFTKLVTNSNSVNGLHG